jgi:hypothetical protein
VFSRNPADRPGIARVFYVVGTGSYCFSNEGTSDGGDHLLPTGVKVQNPWSNNFTAPYVHYDETCN